jgi:K+-transporting ATPase, c chain
MIELLIATTGTALVLCGIAARRPSPRSPNIDALPGTVVERVCPYCGENTKQRVLHADRDLVTVWCISCAIPHDVAREDWGGQRQASASKRKSLERRGIESKARRCAVVIGILFASAVLPMLAPAAASQSAGQISALAEADQPKARANDAIYLWGAPAAPAFAAISSAGAQAKRIAAARGVPVTSVRQLLAEYTLNSQAGEAGIEVSEFNLALDQHFPGR